MCLGCILSYEMHNLLSLLQHNVLRIFCKLFDVEKFHSCETQL